MVCENHNTGNKCNFYCNIYSFYKVGQFNDILLEVNVIRE